MTIIDHIQYLITRHDCVVVAGIGAFVCQHVPARLSDSGCVLLPPSRVVVFNGSISHDDGLLAGSVARREAITLDAARREVDRQVETLLSRIDLDGFIELPRIGRLSRTAEGALAFQPAEIAPIVNARYSAFPVVEIADEHAENEEAQILEVDLSGRRRIRRAVASVGRYAAACVGLILLGATLSTPIIVDRKVDYASLAPAVKPAKTVTLPAVNTDVVKSDNIDRNTASAENEVLMPAIIAVSDIKGDVVPDGYDCYIVVASCLSKDEARSYIAAHGGADKLRIIEGDGRYRVYSAVARDYDEAFNFKSTDAQFIENHPSAWVLKTL